MVAAAVRNCVSTPFNFMEILFLREAVKQELKLTTNESFRL